MQKTSLTISYLRFYRKRETGNPVFVYKVTGNEADMKAYETDKGKNFKKDEKTGDVLFFTGRAAAPGCDKLLRIEKGEGKDKTVDYIANDEMAAKIESLVKQHGKDAAEIMLKNELALAPSQNQ